MGCRSICLVSIGLIAFAVPGRPLIAQSAPEGDAPAAAEETPAQKLNILLRDAQVLQQRKRFLDALTKLDEAEKIDSGRAEIFNIRGAVYLSAQLRDFDKAREQFKRARDLQPQELPAHFNLAEADYVQGWYPDGEKGFAALLEKFPKLPTSVRHLILFKQIVCMLRQNKLGSAERLMQDSYTFMDDTPAYYFSKAALALQKKDEKTGNKWLTKAQVIFKKGETNAYLDTLMEGHYLDSLDVGKAEGQEKEKAQ
jgi:tetratricopeptide (TPR) repeat protein